MNPFKPKTKTKSWFLPALIPPVVLGMMLLLKSTPFGRQLENLSENWRFQFRSLSDPPPDERILVAGVGDYSLATAGRWEDWTRDIHAMFCQKLTLKPPKALVYDFFFSEKSREPAHDLAFADALSLHPGAVTGAIANPDSVQKQAYKAATIGKTEAIKKVIGDRSRVLSAPNGTLPIEDIAVSAWTGFVNVPPLDVDGIRRRIPLFVDLNGQVYPSLVLQAILQYEELTTEDVEIRIDDAVVLTRNGTLLHRIPIDENGFMRINYRKTGGFETWDYIKITQLLDTFEKTGQWPDHDAPKIEGRIMIVGQVAEGLYDFGPTPFKAIEPNVYIQANALNTILRGDFLREVGWNSVGVGWLALAWLTMLGLHRAGIIKAILVPLVVILAFVLSAFLAFRFLSISVPLFLPVAGFIAIHASTIIHRLTEETRSRRQIRNVLGAYISAELVNRIIDSGVEPGLGGEKKEITAFFSDIQNFSTLSEELPPERLMGLMITYLTEMTDVMMHNRGLLDKYIGDAMVGMFGALVPTENHAYKAVATAIGIQRCQNILREQWRKEGIWPESVCHMRTRIGINTGEAIVGNMGSNRRFNYTMIGDTVNLAARCESGSKSYGVQTLVTAETRAAAIQFKDDIVYRSIDRIVVRGRVAPVDVFEVLGFKKEVPERVMECIRHYEEGMRAYQEQRWDDAAAKFSLAERLEALQPGVDPGVSITPSIVMLRRVNYLKANPPGVDWSGVYRMGSK